MQAAAAGCKSAESVGHWSGATIVHMTEDLNRQNELKKMTLCEPCTGIQRNWRRAPGHAELLQGGNRQVPSKGSLVTITSYRCDRCGAAWEYENDKANQQAGWSVVGRPAG